MLAARLTRCSKLADWDDDDPSTLQETSSRFDKVVILKHMFTLAELEVRGIDSQTPEKRPNVLETNESQEDPAAILDIKEDIREECGKLGDVTNVVLFDQEPAGVASVRFANATAAEACVRVRRIIAMYALHSADGVQLMNGRWFDERQLEAHISTGKEKFIRSDTKKASVKLGESESDEDEASVQRVESL